MRRPHSYRKEKEVIWEKGDKTEKEKETTGKGNEKEEVKRAGREGEIEEKRY